MIQKVKLLIALFLALFINLYLYQYAFNKDRYWTSDIDINHIHQNKYDAIYLSSSRKGVTGIRGKNPKLQRLQDKFGSRKRDNNENIDKKIQSNFKKSKHSSYNGTKYLIYLCNHNGSCGGWADRQRAIISVFLLAQVTKRNFGISLTSPCDLKKFYVPNEYNWAINENELTDLSTKTPNDRLNNISVLDFNKAYSEDVIYLRTNRDMFYAIKENPLYSKFIPDWAKFKKPVSFKNGWNLLMKRSKTFDNKFQKMMSKIPVQGELTCAHLRMGKNPSIPMESKSLNSLSSVASLWKFLGSYVANASRLFIATDSAEVRLWARRHFKEKELDTDLTIMHVAKQKLVKNACDGFESVLLDQAILSRCKILVCSMSNFCKQAVFIGGMHEKVFMFNNGSVYPMSIS